MSRESGPQAFVPCSANAESHDPGHGPSHQQAGARPEPGAMALAQDFAGQSHKKPGQSHGFEPKPSQNITSTVPAACLLDRFKSKHVSFGSETKDRDATEAFARNRLVEC